jgi:hypothetical protein
MRWRLNPILTSGNLDDLGHDRGPVASVHIVLHRRHNMAVGADWILEPNTPRVA